MGTNPFLPYSCILNSSVGERGGKIGALPLLLVFKH